MEGVGGEGLVTFDAASEYISLVQFCGNRELAGLADDFIADGCGTVEAVFAMDVEESPAHRGFSVVNGVRAARLSARTACVSERRAAGV